MQLQPVELIRHQMAGAGHEAGTDTKRLGAEAQVEAGRLNLVGIELCLAFQPSRIKQRSNGAIG